jgi:hypothetical protein
MLVPRLVVVLAVSLLLSAILPPPSAAQLPIGRLGGTVKDIAGQPIKGAAIHMASPSTTSAEFTTKSDSKGRWTMLGLRGGRWDVTASAAGFEPSTVTVPVSSFQGGPPIEFVLLGVAPHAPLDGVDTLQLQTELRRAESQMGQQRWDDALATYRAIQARVPALDSINLAVGQALRMKKDYAGAEAAYGALLNRDARNQKAMLELARTQNESGDPAAAAATIQRLLVIGEATDEAAAARELLAEIRK